MTAVILFILLIFSGLCFFIGLFKPTEEMKTAKNRKGILAFFALLTFIFLFSFIGTISSTSGSSTNKQANSLVGTSPKATLTTKPTITTTKTPPKTTPKTTPITKLTGTPSLTPTTAFTTTSNDSHGFPMDYQTVTVADMSKTPSQYDGKTVMFECDVTSFARDSSGDVSAVNCSDLNDETLLAQVDTSNMDNTKINQGDDVFFYGFGEGALTGKNAYGQDVTEAGVTGMYIDDTTSGYSNSK